MRRFKLDVSHDDQRNHERMPGMLMQHGAGGRGLRAGCYLLLVLLQALSVASADSNQNGAWLGAALNGKLGESSSSRWGWSLDSQYRFQNASVDVTTILVRPAIGYTVNPQLSLRAGYGWFATDAAGIERIDEHRLWQDLVWRPALDSALRVGLRTRMEQRWLDGGNDAGWRFRQLVRLDWPISADGKVALLAANEVLIALNDTDWGERSGLDQNRVFLGFSIRVAPRSYVDLAYLNLYIDRPLVEDVVTHLLFAALRVSF